MIVRVIFLFLPGKMHLKTTLLCTFIVFLFCLTHTAAHINTHVYIYIYVCVWVSVCVWKKTVMTANYLVIHRFLTSENV